MNHTRALLLGGACCLGLVLYVMTANTSIGAALRDSISPASKPSAQPTSAIRVAADEAAPAEAAAPAAGPVAGVTSFYGGEASSTAPAWAAEATMNADYTTAGEAPPAAADAAPAAEAAAPAAAAADAPASAVTSYYGGVDSGTAPAWAAEATMNADYSASDAAPAAAPETTDVPTPAVAADEPAPASTGGVGVTSFYGDSATPSAPAWAAEATMNADTNASEAPPAATTAAVSEPARQEGIEACRDSLNAEALAGKLLFRSASWDILRESYGPLDRIAKIAKDCGGVLIEVGGHTDNTGKPDGNQKLSAMRADAVVDYLKQAGVDASKLKAVGYGQSNPIATNDTSEGRRKNRRIEFLVTSP